VQRLRVLFANAVYLCCSASGCLQHQSPVNVRILLKLRGEVINIIIYIVYKYKCRIFVSN
jgi:hypothetical protein